MEAEISLAPQALLANEVLPVHLDRHNPDLKDLAAHRVHQGLLACLAHKAKKASKVLRAKEANDAEGRIEKDHQMMQWMQIQAMIQALVESK